MVYIRVYILCLSRRNHKTIKDESKIRRKKYIMRKEARKIDIDDLVDMEDSDDIFDFYNAFQEKEKEGELDVSPIEFFSRVEDRVWEKDITYLDSILEISKELNLEPEEVSKIITKELFIKLEEECENFKLLKANKRSRLVF